MPQQAASIALVSQDGSTATFHVHDEDKKDDQEYNKWVRVDPFDAADVPQAPLFVPIRWDENTPPADDCEVSASYGGGVRYEAYIVLWPNVVTPRSNTVEF